MRAVFIIDETYFFHPRMLSRLVLRRPDLIVAVGLVKSVPQKNDLTGYIVRNAGRLRWREMLLLGATRAAYAVLGAARRRLRLDFLPPLSVEDVCREAGLPFFPIHDRLSRDEHEPILRALRPDVVISSNPLFFPRWLLELPAHGCINRHSSLLPSYGGVWPVLQAIAHGERRIGVSVHRMTSRIDVGDVLAQKRIALPARPSLYDLYRKCYDLSVDAILEAVERLEGKPSAEPIEPFPPSYYSWPTPEDWRRFRERGGRFI